MGVIYLLLTVLGFIPGLFVGDEMLLGLVHINLADNFLHLVLGGAAASSASLPSTAGRCLAPPEGSKVMEPFSGNPPRIPSAATAVPPHRVGQEEIKGLARNLFAGKFRGRGVRGQRQPTLGGPLGGGEAFRLQLDPHGQSPAGAEGGTVAREGPIRAGAQIHGEHLGDHSAPGDVYGDPLHDAAGSGGFRPRATAASHLSYLGPRHSQGSSKGFQWKVYGCYELAGPDTVTFDEAFERFGKASGKKIWVLHMPLAVLRLPGRVSPYVRELADMMTLFDVAGYAADPSILRGTFGVSAPTLQEEWAGEDH
ncbi:MAG: hypothetical protein M3317_01670 [Actinomycetota bacterium]|nr:hypothetical protein [Actinomycetota bacterium]